MILPNHAIIILAIVAFFGWLLFGGEGALVATLVTIVLIVIYDIAVYSAATKAIDEEIESCKRDVAEILRQSEERKSRKI